MRAPRANASDRREIVVTANPASSPHSEAHVSAGLIRKSRKWVSATTTMEWEGSGIERHARGTPDDYADCPDDDCSGGGGVVCPLNCRRPRAASSDFRHRPLSKRGSRWAALAPCA